MPRRRPDGGKMSSKEILPLQDPWNDAWRATEQLARNRFPGYGDLPVGTPPVRQWPYVRGTQPATRTWQPALPAPVRLVRRPASLREASVPVHRPAQRPPLPPVSVHRPSEWAPTRRGTPRVVAARHTRTARAAGSGPQAPRRRSPARPQPDGAASHHEKCAKYLCQTCPSKASLDKKP